MLKKLGGVVATLLFAAVSQPLPAQDAAQPTVDLPALPAPQSEQATPTPLPSLSPDVPELSRLDEAFKRTSIGKAADEFRQRVEIRKLQNRVSNDEEIAAARRSAETARTDLEKRERLREYYNIYYGKMRRLAPDEHTRKTLDDVKAAHVKLLEQPHVRPVPGEPLPPVTKTEKKAKPKKFHLGRSTGR